jgi:hypothetical protein
MTLEFDPLTTAGVLSGDVKVTCLDPDATPNKVLELGNPWTGRVSWFIDGLGIAALAGEWEARLFIESMGPGVEQEIAPPITKDLVADLLPSSTATHHEYRADFPVPANTPPDEGVYRITGLITYTNPFGNRMAMAGFSEGEMIQFYKPS